MKTQDVRNSPVDLKQFFKASVDALGNDRAPRKTSDRIIARNNPLFHRAGADGNVRQRALADAANALSALWNLQSSKNALRVPMVEPKATSLPASAVDQ